MELFLSARIDGLVKREETPEEMTETFVDRDDFMYYRHVSFGKRVKKFGPQDANARPIAVRFQQPVLLKCRNELKCWKAIKELRWFRIGTDFV